MLYSKIIAVCPQIHTKHINTLCGQNVELLDVNLAVHIVNIEPNCAKTTNFLATCNVFISLSTT
jgi:hypothetical protein